MNWQEQLISTYLLICKEFDEGLSHFCERMTNYANLRITDEEVVSLFIFGIMKKKKTLKEIHDYACDHLGDWFPCLPSYVGFIQRLNRLCDVFVPLIECLQEVLPNRFKKRLKRLMDSMPIIIAQRGRRFHAKVAPELASANGYCATKKLHYYGVKLHVLGAYEKGSIPIPEYIGLTSAGMADRKAYEQLLPALFEMDLFADKAYQIQDQPLLTEEEVQLYTPVKKAKGQKVLDSADRLLSSAISSVRQPIDSFFNWLEEKTKIQMASKVRSTSGLLVHVFGRLAAAFCILVQKNLTII